MALDSIGNNAKTNGIQPSLEPPQSTATNIRSSPADVSDGEVRSKLLEQSVSAFFAKQRVLNTNYQTNASNLRPWAATDTGAAATSAPGNTTSSVAGTSTMTVAAVPLIPVAIWIGKAAVATTVDAFVEYGIAAITGAPPPGFWDHAGNFILNLIPGAGEAKKAERVVKFFKVLDDVIDVARALNKLPNGAKFADNLAKNVADLKKAIREGNLNKAKGLFNNIIGHYREAQVASKLGGKVVDVNVEVFDRFGKALTDIDVVSRKGKHLVYGQVKSGNAANLKRGSDGFAKFEAQADKTFRAAKEARHTKGAAADVVYYVDEISDDARTLLNRLAQKYGVSVEVKLNQQFLHLE